jgi:molecular chaperone DnaK
VHVSAKDRATGKEQKIVVQASSGLSDEEIDGMVKDADEHMEDDRKKRELAEVRNRADNLVYTTEKSLKDFEGKISDDDRSAVNEAISELKGVLAGTDVDIIKAKTDELSKRWSGIAEALYKAAADEQAKAEANTAADQGGKAGDEGGDESAERGGEAASGEKEETVDADFNIVDDEGEAAKAE